MVFSKYIMPAMDKTKHFQIDLNFLLDLKKQTETGFPVLFICFNRQNFKSNTKLV